MIVSAAPGSRTVVRVGGRRHAKGRGKYDTMSIWVNHIDKAANISSVVINSDGWWTAHVVVGLKC